MKRLLILTFICLISAFIKVQGKSSSAPIIYIDGNGVMRWSDTRREASFFGVNYTLLFAHAYHAIGYSGLDRKAAIDEDVYHTSRLGLNVYRIHLWDVELIDGQRNLLENEYLDLMDYLIAKLKERNIHVVITVQANFGDRYSERNIQTGGFSYKYDKCDMYSHPESIVAQGTYLHGLMKHVNPYTGLAYKDDPSIVGFEINNEPCHSGTEEEAKAYISRMLKAVNKIGNRKPVFYDVSHNGYVVETYYETAIRGATCQWYPTGLVSGQARQGNFLPYIDRYDIPSSDKVKGFNRKIRMVYEFDPADIMYSYTYPAMVRTFRTAGFQQITQFAYDPMDIAYASTKYQTHFSNLAYTPHKTISMKIAAEAARSLKRNESYDSYPQDTLFGDGFLVSYMKDLSELNNGKKFYYSNYTNIRPKSASQLVSIASCGSSPVIRYEGTGAYFMDCPEPGVWRLEVMPDAVVVSGPFAKPSPDKEVVTIAYDAWDMALQIPDLGMEFTFTALNQGSQQKGDVADGIIRGLCPGTYLLKRKNCAPRQNWQADSQWNSIRIGEYVAPTPRVTDYKVIHTPSAAAEANKDLMIGAQVVGTEFPDSAIIYTNKIFFWSEHNPYVKMKRTDGYTYRATIPATEMKDDCLRYNIIVCRGNSTRTYPTGDSDYRNSSSGIKGNPLDWNYTSKAYRTTRVVAPDSVIPLLTITDADSRIETYTLPEWNDLQRTLIDSSPVEKPLFRFRFTPKGENPHYFLRMFVKSLIEERREKVKGCSVLCIRVNRTKALPEGFSVGSVTSDGYTYKSPCPAPSSEGIIRILLKDLRQTDTALLPIVYPTFLKQHFHPETEIAFLPERIEKLELSASRSKEGLVEIELGNIWLE